MSETPAAHHSIARIAQAHDLASKDLPVWSIRAALHDAYELGKLDQQRARRLR
jgi:hypothetical protein